MREQNVLLQGSTIDIFLFYKYQLKHRHIQNKIIINLSRVFEHAKFRQNLVDYK